MINFNVIGGNVDAVITVENQWEEEHIYYADVKMKLAEEQLPEKFSLLWKFPAKDCFSIWSPSCKTVRNLGPEWLKQVTNARLASGMPIHTVLSIEGKNKMTIALSDAVTPTAIATGICEEDAHITCRVDFFTVPVAHLKEYSATIRIDLRDVAYYDSIYDVVSWWEKECGYKPAGVPEYAKLPMNSLWYSYHQQLDVEDILKECRLSKALGMETVIVDDGWQTDDNSRGYAFCGDWEVAQKKIPDMKEFVNRVHDTGMKIMLWYSVPYVGIESKNYPRFKDMLLDETGNNRKYWALDPRYKEVREFLIKTYSDAVSQWGLDGLKLDFIDSFILKGKSLEYDERRDYLALEDAIDRLMMDIMKQLREIKPDIMIEFRQSYVGPAIRKYGNILRVADCPADAIANRMGVVDLRFTSGNTAVHSDMLMWNYEEPVECAALQIANVLYAVPQISVKIARLNPKHKKMLAYYLRFWIENREVLLEGKVTALHPEGNYSLVCAAKDGKAIFTAYTERVIPEGYGDQIIVVNAGGSEELILKGYKGASYEVVNCMGEEVERGELTESIHPVKVPLAGMLKVCPKI